MGVQRAELGSGQGSDVEAHLSFLYGKWEALGGTHEPATPGAFRTDWAKPQ